MSGEVGAALDVAVIHKYREEWARAFRNHILLSGGEVNEEALKDALQVADSLVAPFTVRTLPAEVLTKGVTFRLFMRNIRNLNLVPRTSVILSLSFADRTPDWDFEVVRNAHDLSRTLETIP